MSKYIQHIVLMVLCIHVLSGCVFAPSKYGSSGVVYPGRPQYDKYLKNCRDRYSLLEDCCRRWGDPSAIQIGSSGGYFVWRKNPEWLKVKIFSATVIYGQHPKKLRSFVFDEEGLKKMDTHKRRDSKEPVGKTASVSYSVESFQRLADDNFAYSFRLRLRDGADAGISAMDQIKKELRATIASDYVGAHGGKISEVHVDLPEFTLKDSVIEGRAEIMQITVESLRYDSQTQKGVIAIKIGSSRFEDARKWVRKNIESLARDKNVALTTGQIPDASRFYLGTERVKQGNILEIEFETE